MPKVSIILPVYNGEKTLAKSLKSIADQTYRDFETIVVDNNSTDDSVSIAESFTETANVRVVHCEHQGLVPSLNFGLCHAGSEYIARQDDDDFWYPDKLEKQMALFEKDPELSVIGTQIRTLDPDGRVEDMGTFGKKVNYAVEDYGIKQMLMIGQNPICHPSVVVKRSAMLRVGGYSDLWHLAEDFELWCRLLPFAKFANIDEVLIDYTQTVREDYDPNLVILISNMYYQLYKHLGIIQGERPDVLAEWQIKQMMEQMKNES